MPAEVLDESLPSTITLPSRKPVTSTIPLSMPALLQNRGPFSHLYASATRKAPKSDSGSGSGRRENVGGKRKARRHENDKFINSPGMMRPTLADFSPLPVYSSSFAPPPNSSLFPRSLYVTPVPVTRPSPEDSAAGRFHSSLKGVRKILRSGREGGRSEIIVSSIEKELIAWLNESGFQRWHSEAGRVIDATLVKETIESENEESAIVEVSRNAGNLLWAIGDPYTRFVVHCVARYYSLVSFSKVTAPTSLRSTPQRLTHILRPLVMRPVQGETGMDTPPTTDLSASEVSELESGAYLASELDSASSIGDQESELGDGEWEEMVRAEEQRVGQRDDQRQRSGSLARSEDDRGTVGSRESTTDDEDEFSEDGEFEGGLDSMTSSLAFLPPLSTPSRLAPSASHLRTTPTDGSSTPTPRATTLGSSRPSRLTSALYLNTTGDADGAATPRGGLHRERAPRSAGSSPSRSPTRLVRAPIVVERSLRGAGNAEIVFGGVRREGKAKRGWELPDMTFHSYVFK